VSGIGGVKRKTGDHSENLGEQRPGDDARSLGSVSEVTKPIRGGKGRREGEGASPSLIRGGK